MMMCNQKIDCTNIINCYLYSLYDVCNIKYYMIKLSLIGVEIWGRYARNIIAVAHPFSLHCYFIIFPKYIGSGGVAVTTVDWCILCVISRCSRF